jgi:hypothetical protein
VSGPRIAFVTAAELVHEDEDRPFLDAAAATHGVVVEWRCWDDSTVDWSTFDAVVIRSTWDYHRRLDEFVHWVGTVSTVSRLWNGPEVVAWNVHKRYLLDLEDSGVPIVPTELVERIRPRSLGPILDARGWDQVILKPAVSAGAKDTARFHDGDPAADRALRRMLDDGDVLVQPYLDAIESQGETSLVAVDGLVLHAVGKVPAAGDFRVQIQYGGRDRPIEPTPAEVDLARWALAAAARHGDILYARVDCIDVDGVPLLMELELVEPALYLQHAPSEAAHSFVAAIVDPR